MRLRWRFLLVLLLIATAVGGAWAYLHQEQLARTWEMSRVAAASNYGEAKAILSPFDQEPDRDAKLRQMMGKWGTGNPRFDFYLARYVGDADSSESARELFSYELGWRSGLLDRWAYYWSWQAGDPNREMAELAGYLDLVVKTNAAKPLTWREVLNVQAMFQLTGDSDAALRLSPANWSSRYRSWRAEHPGELPHAESRQMPFDDWSGGVPEEGRR
jgi:hypothetical protein